MYHDLGDHSETFQVDFDPSKISYAQLLDLFWSAHNPCGGGGSRQYRSAVFYADEAQKRLALESKTRVQLERGKVTTAVEPLGTFTLAEAYHQKYALRNTPELAREFARIYPRDEDFVNSTAAARVNAYLSGEGTAEQFHAEVGRLGLSEKGQETLRNRTSVVR